MAAGVGQTNSTTCAFIVPFFGDQDRSVQYLDEMLDGIFSQNDADWHVIIVDDATPDESAKNHLNAVHERNRDKMTVIWQQENNGHGVARNVAVRWAVERDMPFVLYNDADDISHPDRVGVVREIFATQPDVDLIYSSFEAVDEHGAPVSAANMTASHAERAAVYDEDPIEGANAWIRIGVGPGSVGITSSTSVRARLAVACPTPTRTPSEGLHQWMHIAAKGNEIKYTPLIPSKYRISSSVNGSSHHRQRLGEKAFYTRSVEVKTDGFFNAIDIALKKGDIASEAVGSLRTKFCLRLAEDLLKAGQMELAAEVLTRDLSVEYPGLMRLLLRHRE